MKYATRVKCSGFAELEMPRVARRDTCYARDERKNMKFINIGFGNMVSAGRIITIASPDSAPIKRLVQDAKEDGRVIDVSCGRRTRSVIVTDSDHVILSAIQAETVAGRLSFDGDDEETDPDDE